jgi:TRAP-type C4-dicarboxylate transport system permease small subunit
MFKPNTHENYSAHLKWLAAHFEEALCAGLLLLLAVLAFANIVVRYLSNFSFAFTEELEVSGLVYLTFFGAAAAFRRGLHIGLSFLYERFPRNARRLALLVSAALSVFVFLVLIYFSIQEIQVEVKLNVLSEALVIPQWIYTLALPVGSILVIIRVIERAWAIFKEE